MALVQLSVEETIKRFSITDKDIQELLALISTSPDQNVGSFANNTCSPYDGIDLIDPQNCDIGKNDLDVYFPRFGSSKGHTIDTSDHLALNNELLNPFKQINHKHKQVSTKSNHVLLSPSVGVTMPAKPNDSSHTIEIVNDLEEKYKPRYKSDYFSQDGTVRKPRYVADQLHNHYVSIKTKPGIQGLIQVDWVTIPNEENIRFSMPYKFQVNNDLPNVPDFNPVYAPIDADSSGVTKLYLVLIKSKQDELKNIPSLQVFPPVLEISDKNTSKQMPSLMPKQFIQKYQLEKSQLSFTFCPLSPDGESYVADWNTTVYSTVITEAPADPSKKRKINCPKCSHSFEIIMEGADDIRHEKVIKKRKT